MPTRPNLEYYRKQAKALLKAVQSGDSAARLSAVAASINSFNMPAPGDTSHA